MKGGDDWFWMEVNFSANTSVRAILEFDNFSSLGDVMSAHPSLIEPAYDVVWPLGRPAYATRAPVERVADLNNKVIGETWDYLFRGEEWFPMLREALTKRYPGIRFVTYETFGNLHGPHQRELVAKVPELLKKHKVDAVISAIGA